MSMKKLADRAGCSDDSVSLWERGRTEPYFGNALNLAEALGVPIGALAYDAVCERCVKGIERGCL